MHNDASPATQRAARRPRRGVVGGSRSAAHIVVVDGGLTPTRRSHGSSRGRRTLRYSEEPNRPDEGSTTTTTTTTTTIESSSSGNSRHRAIPTPHGASGGVVALGTILFLLLVAPLDAHAGFGPSSGATTSSPPNLVAPSVLRKQNNNGNAVVAGGGGGEINNNNVELNNSKKLKQLIGSTLDDKRLREFSSQLDELAESLRNLLAAEDEEVEQQQQQRAGEEGTTGENEERRIFAPPSAAWLKGREERRAELEKARVLQEQIADRERLLSELENQPYWFNYLAAFAGSVASTLVMHPVDTIKTRLQVNGSLKGGGGGGRRNEDGDDEQNDNDNEFASLYEGLAGNILKEGPPSALYLGVYESVKYALLPLYGPEYKLLIYLAAGAAGELVGSVVRAPAEAIKSTVQSGIAGSAPEAATLVFGTVESRKNVFLAWSSSVWRDVPFGAIQLAVFELVKSRILNDPDIDFDSSTLQSEALIGAFAGGFGALLTNPFDVVTTRIITQSVDDGDEEALGVVEMGKRVYEGGGIGAFMAGWQFRVMYWAPAISIFLSCYCSVRQAGVENGWFN